MTDTSQVEAPASVFDTPTGVVPPRAVPPVVPRRRSRAPFVVASGLVAALGLGLVVTGANGRSDASSTRARTEEVRRRTADAEKARQAAIADADSSRQKAATVDKQKADLDARMKRLSATLQDGVQAANRIMDDCLVPWSSRQISSGQALACLPGRIRDNEAAVAAETQAVADVRSALTALEGELNG